nr:DUF6286 domain-containing protein [Kineococcus vitellinus]
MFLLLTALGRRSRNAVAFAGAPGVFCTVRDVARIASATARRCDGVLEARSTAGRRTVAVEVRATSGQVRDDVQRAVEEQVRVLSPAPPGARAGQERRVSRAVIAVDRLLALVLGLLLAVGGLAAMAWWTGDLARVLPGAGTGSALGTGAVAELPGYSWYPWAAAGAALVLGLLALWWLLAHVPRRGAGQLLLPGSGPRGGLRVEADGPARAAADVLAATPGVRSASGRVVTDRGRLVAELAATVEPSADLAEVAATAQQVQEQLLQVLGRPDVRGRPRAGCARADRAARVA